MQTYCTLLSDQLQPTICKKRRGFLQKVSLFNMSMTFTIQHPSDSRERTEEMDWELLPHAQYSPDLAPSDFHLFRLLKKSLRGIKFENNV